MGKSRPTQRAQWADLRARLEEATKQRREFDATFIGPPKPRRRTGIGMGFDLLFSAGDRLRAEVRASVLQEMKAAASEKARQRSYRRREAEYADHARALRLASTMHERHRVDAAAKIADILEAEGRHYEVRTVDRWLSRPNWKPPTEAAPG